MQKRGIKLSLVDDVKQVTINYYEKVDTALSKAQGGIKALKDSASSFENAMQISKELNALLIKIESAAKELGVEPTQWEMYKELKTAISSIKTNQDLLNSLNKSISLLEI